MQLKNVIDSPCGLRFMLDKLELQSGFARRWLLDSSMMTQGEDIAAACGQLAGQVRKPQAGREAGKDGKPSSKQTRKK